MTEVNIVLREHLVFIKALSFDTDKALYSLSNCSTSLIQL